MNGKKTWRKNIHASVFKLTSFHFSIGNFCHRKWELLPKLSGNGSSIWYGSLLCLRWVFHLLGEDFSHWTAEPFGARISPTRSVLPQPVKLPIFYTEVNVLVNTSEANCLKTSRVSTSPPPPNTLILSSWFLCKTGGIVQSRLLAYVFLAAKVQVSETFLQARVEKKCVKE